MLVEITECISIAGVITKEGMMGQSAANPYFVILFLMNGPQRTAVSRKELWQKRKQKEFPADMVRIFTDHSPR